MRLRSSYLLIPGIPPTIGWSCVEFSILTVWPLVAPPVPKPDGLRLGRQIYLYSIPGQRQVFGTTPDRAREPNGAYRTLVATPIRFKTPSPQPTTLRRSAANILRTPST